jgi:hypothetical protein
MSAWHTTLRCGWSARVICTTRKCDRGFNIVALVQEPARPEIEWVLRYQQDGRFIDGIYGKYDLMGVSVSTDDMSGDNFISDKRHQSHMDGYTR